jgi:hypothetical protein
VAITSAALLGAFGFFLLLSVPEPPGEPLPGRALAARVERQLEADRGRLALSPSHEALVFPLEQRELLAFMDRVRVWGDDREVVLGTDRGFESHGGGLLALLLDHWQPDGHPAWLDDRFPFRSGPVALAAIYASLLRQVVLPETGLPRVRFGGSGALAGMRPVETDAYSLLRILAVRATDLDARWETFAGPETSAAELLDRAREVYLAGTDSPGEPADHSELHLVEVLLAASARQGRDPEPVKGRFLAHELARADFEPETRTLLLAHYAESLGLLAADDRLAWSDDERRRVRGWLARLEAEGFLRPHEVAPRELAHLLRGLRLVHANAERLGGAPPAD